MRRSYERIHRYLILYVVLSFTDNKHLGTCQKLRSKTKPKDPGYAADDAALVPAEGKPQHGVTCYTCVNVSDNHVCNKYAIDKPCKPGNDFCHSLHIMDPQGKSVLVNKKCANETECTPNSIGCYHIDNQKICISCCDEDYCNRKVPTQTSNATFKNARTLRQKLRESRRGRDRGGGSLSGSAGGGVPTPLVCYLLSFLRALP